MFVCSIVALATLAAASPLGQRSDGPSYPPTSSSKGFRLVANVTDTSRDLSPSVQNQYVTSIHVGAGLNLVGVGSKDVSRLFYINGTTGEFMRGEATTVTDGATPLVPFGFTLTEDSADSAMSTAHLNGGPGTKGDVTTRIPVPYVFLAPEQMAICDEYVAYYQKNMQIVKQLNLNKNKTLPANCAPVRLMAECAELNELPEGSLSNHDNVYTGGCYDDVASIEWSKYTAWGN